MKKTKMDKGITLIALLITIVLLLILAVVSISSITNDGIIGKAESEAEKYNQSAKEEQNTVDYYDSYLTGTLGQWQQNGTEVKKKNEDGSTIKLTVGQTVTGYDGYSGSYSGEWAVLGVENGKLLLVSATNVQNSVKLKGRNGDTENGYVAGYYNGIEKLDEICQSYLNSSLADKARSITVEDINRVTGYNPENPKYGTIYGAGYVSQYGRKVKFYMGPGESYNGEQYALFTDFEGPYFYNSFESIDETILYYSETGQNSVVINNNYYEYDVREYLSGVTLVNLFTSTRSINNPYWLVSTYEKAYYGGASWGILCVENAQVKGAEMWDNSSGPAEGSWGVRAVVCLKSDVTVSETGEISSK